MKTLRTMREFRRLKTKRLPADTLVRVKNRQTDRTYILNQTKNRDTLTSLSYPRIGLTPADFEKLGNEELRIARR